MDLRFLRKIITDEENEIVNLAQNSDTELRVFWACKEVTYKIIKDLTMKIISHLVVGLLIENYSQRNILYLRTLKVMINLETTWGNIINSMQVIERRLIKSYDAHMIISRIDLIDAY
jgi:phosphopantetheinyl transferase (holo-ACP synthase)